MAFPTHLEKEIPLRGSCLGIPAHGGASRAAVHGVTASGMQLSEQRLKMLEVVFWTEEGVAARMPAFAFGIGIVNAIGGDGASS